MSEENVEIIRQLWAYFRETGEPDFSILDDRIEVHDHDVPDAPVYRGHDGYVRWMEDWGSAWAKYTAEPEEFIDAGERVVVFVRMTATGRGSGVTLARQDAQVFQLSNGKVVRSDYFNDRDEALEATGLSEQAMSEGAFEIVQAHIEAFDRADAKEALSYLDPYIVLDPSRVDFAITWDVTLGHEALDQLVRRFRGAFEEYSYEVGRLTPIGSCSVVALVTETGRGRTSGVPIERSYAVLYTVMNRKIIRITIFPTEEEALEAAGLSEQVMSEEQVEIVRRVFEAIGRHDTEAVLSAYDPNVEFDFSEGPLPSLMGDKVYRGHDGIRKFVRTRYEDWENIEDDCQELIDAGERVISRVITRARGRSSGVDTEVTQYGVQTFREGKIVRVDWFYSRDDAFEVAGRSEQAQLVQHGRVLGVGHDAWTARGLVITSLPGLSSVWARVFLWVRLGRIAAVTEARRSALTWVDLSTPQVQG